MKRHKDNNQLKVQTVLYGKLYTLEVIYEVTSTCLIKMETKEFVEFIPTVEKNMESYLLTI